MIDWTLSHRAFDMGRSNGLRTSCTGVYRVVDEERNGPALAECDGCGEVVGVARVLLDAPSEPVRGDEWLR